MTKSEIFTNAWEIARNAQNKFGGKVSEYFAESLRLAYKLAKGEVAMTFVLEMEAGSRKHKPWVAKIEGEDAKWNFKRDFIKASGYGEWTLEDGVYDVKGDVHNIEGISYERRYIKVKNGIAKEINENEVLSLI